MTTTMTLTENAKGSLDGFHKIGTDVSPSLVHVAMWNPETKELRRIVVEDYEYAYPDGPFMAGSVREYGLDTIERIHDAPVDKDALRDFNIHNNIVFVRAIVKVAKGRKVPIGTTGTVTRIRQIHDRYGRRVSTYADFEAEDGTRHSTNIANLTVIG